MIADYNKLYRNEGIFFLIPSFLHLIKSVVVSLAFICLVTGCNPDENILHVYDENKEQQGPEDENKEQQGSEDENKEQQGSEEEFKEQQNLLIGSSWDSYYGTMCNSYSYLLTFRPDMTGQWSYTYTHYTDDYKLEVSEEEHYSVDFFYEFSDDNKLKISVKGENGSYDESLWVYKLTKTWITTSGIRWMDIEISYYSGNRHILKDDISNFEFLYNPYYKYD